jgi:hypothetical protein
MERRRAHSRYSRTTDSTADARCRRDPFRFRRALLGPLDLGTRRRALADRRRGIRAADRAVGDPAGTRRSSSAWAGNGRRGARFRLVGSGKHCCRAGDGLSSDGRRSLTGHRVRHKKPRRRASRLKTARWKQRYTPKPNRRLKAAPRPTSAVPKGRSDAGSGTASTAGS